MTQKQKRTTVPVLMLGIFFLFTAGMVLAEDPSDEPSETIADLDTSEVRQETEGQVPETPESSEEDEQSPVDEGTQSESEAPAAPSKWAAYPNVCETFTVIEGSERVRNRDGKLVYPVRYKRNRYDRKRSDQRRTRELIRLVAREMGADEAGQYLVDMIAHHESSWNPEALHILNRDREANLAAWERHSYDRGREIQLEKKLEEADARTREYWRIRAQLADLRLYKGNSFWDARLKYERKIPERTLHGETTEAMEVEEERSVWAYGYGLYGMNSVLFVHVWDREAPPWILCGDEGIVATVTAIWALREHQEECGYLTDKDEEKHGTDGGNARGVIRRFARGHCGDGRLGPVWRRLMKEYGDHVDWDSVPDLGHKFTRYEMYRRNGKWVYRYEKEIDPETGKERYKRNERGQKIKVPADREAILAHMREKAAKAGLLREEPLERKQPDTEPVVVASRPANAAP
jgi:hypothetical protein